MQDDAPFDLRDFMPYLLNQAADASSRDFQSYYKGKYGMLRTEWRVLFHLGRYGAMTARQVCDRAGIHKTKVSRAVAALDSKRFVRREEMAHDRRHEQLRLTAQGRSVFADLTQEAQRFDAAMLAEFTETEVKQIRAFLTRIAGL
ncbi:MAG: MarR family winged helix-turn-helix transcriptional regulator [Pseudomonadota bacterium]